MGDPRSPRSSSLLLGSVIAELAAGSVLVTASATVDGDGLRAVVVATALALVGVRALHGARRGGRRGGGGRVRRADGARRAGVAAGWAWAGLTAVHLLVIVPGLRDVADLPVAAALAGLGTVPLASGLLAARWVPGLPAGRRDDLTPGLLAGALGGGAGVLVAIALGNVVDVGDARLAALTPYVAAGTAVLALAELLSHHRVGAGFAGTVVPLVGVALVVEVLVLADRGTAPVDSAVTGLVVGSGTAAVGLLVATALASPRPLAVPLPQAGDGPRFVGWTVAALVLFAAGVRLAAAHPLWLDEATSVQGAGGRFSDAVSLTGRADPHPPLSDGLLWVARQLAGAGDLAVRLPALAAGLLLVPAAYVTATRLYDRRVGLATAVVVAVGPGLVWLSGIARPGIVAALLVTLALLTMLRSVEDGRLADWALFGLAGAALLWSHQLALVPVVVLHAAVAVLLWRRARGEPVALDRPRYADDRGHIGTLEADPDVIEADQDTAATPDTPDAAGTADNPTAILSARPHRELLAGWIVALALTGLALALLVVRRGGLGPPDLLPPFEYATPGAPGAGRSVFGLVGTGVVALFGFHPTDVTSRLLALWPLSVLATFLLFWRTWSYRGMLLVALAAAPFLALLALQVAGAPRNPPFALEWVATAIPPLAIGAGRVATLWGRWSRARVVTAALGGLLLVAVVDQTLRIEPVERFDVTAVADTAARRAGDGDVVVYAPDELGDLVRHAAPDAEAVSIDDVTAGDLDEAPRVVVAGAFALVPSDRGLDPTLALVEDLSSRRSLAAEDGHGDTKVWTFR